MNNTALSSGIFLDCPRSSGVETMPANILGRVSFFRGCDSATVQNAFSVCSDKFDATYHEHWLVNEVVTSGVYNSIRFSKGSNYLIGSASMEFRDNQQFKETISRLYEEIFDCIDIQGYPNLARIWNYIPDIHAQQGIDRYQHFCEARHHAFAGHYHDYKGVLPAATAVGIEGRYLHLYFIAAREPVYFCENPRQCSAYEYPSQYGPSSPSFARASLIKRDRAMLLISGTASVLGHESVHENNVAGQTEETMNNIRALIEETNAKHGSAFSGLDSLQHIKVYIRNREDRAIVEGVLSECLGTDTDRVFIIADICRKELLVEIEAIARESA